MNLNNKLLYLITFLTSFSLWSMENESKYPSTYNTSNPTPSAPNTYAYPASYTPPYTPTHNYAPQQYGPYNYAPLSTSFNSGHLYNNYSYNPTGYAYQQQNSTPQPYNYVMPTHDASYQTAYNYPYVSSNYSQNYQGPQQSNTYYAPQEPNAQNYTLAPTSYYYTPPSITNGPPNRPLEPSEHYRQYGPTSHYPRTGQDIARDILPPMPQPNPETGGQPPVDPLRLQMFNILHRKDVEPHPAKEFQVSCHELVSIILDNPKNLSYAHAQEEILKYAKTLNSNSAYTSTADKKAIKQWAEKIEQKRHLVEKALQTCGMSYQDMLTYYPNEEQQLHLREINAIFEQLPDLPTLDCTTTSTIATVAALAFDFNDKDKKEETASALDTALNMSKVIKNFSLSGAHAFLLQPIQDMAHLALHPVQEATNICVALKSLGESLGTLIVANQETLLHPKKWTLPRASDAYGRLEQILQMSKNMSADSWGQTIGTLLGMVYPSAAYKTIGKLATSLKVVTQSEKVAKILKATHIIDAATQLKLLKEGINPDTLLGFAAFQAIESTAAALREAEVVLETVKGSINYVPLLTQATRAGMSVEAYEHRAQRVCLAYKTAYEAEQGLLKLHMLQEYQRKFSIVGIFKPLKYDLEHIFSLGVSKLGKITGFHSDFGGKIQQAGKLAFSHLEEGPNGIYRAIIKCGEKMKESTFFPKSWTPEQVLEKIKEAIANVDLNRLALGNGSITIIGNTTEGIEIEIALNRISGEIFTAYPHYRQWRHGDLMKKASLGQ